MVISDKDFQRLIGAVVKAKASRKGCLLYECRRAPYDGVERRIVDYICSEWNSEIGAFDPLVVLEGVNKPCLLSELEIIG